MIVDIQNGINCWYCLSISFHVAMVFGIILTIILLQFRDYFSNFQGIFWQYFKFFTARRQSLGQGNIFTGVCLSTGGRGFPDREPPPPYGKERPVRILLECILVECCIYRLYLWQVRPPVPILQHKTQVVMFV